MKHNVKVTFLLLFFFVVAQIFGLFFLSLAMEVIPTEDGNQITYQETSIGQRPELDPGSSFASIIIAIVIGTLLALLLIKYKLTSLWM